MNHLYSIGLQSVIIKITLNPSIHIDTHNPTWHKNNITNNFLAIQESWKFHCWIIWVYHFWQLLKAAQCAHMLQTACLFWSAPLKSIHCYSSPPSMSVCLSERYSTYFGWRSEMLCGGQAIKTWTMNCNEQQNIKTQPVTSHYKLLPFVFPLTPSGSSTFFLLSLCSSGWPGYWKLRETLMCSDICDSVRGAESLLLLRNHDLKLWLSVIKWMMTKHFISAQWVRYSSWGIWVLSDRSSCDVHCCTKNGTREICNYAHYQGLNLKPDHISCNFQSNHFTRNDDGRIFNFQLSYNQHLHKKQTYHKHSTNTFLFTLFPYWIILILITLN